MALIDDFTPEQIQELANNSRSLAELREKIGYSKNGGGTNDIVKSYIKKHGVSDNAIRKWCKKYNLPYKKKDIKSYSDEEWGQL